MAGQTPQTPQPAAAASAPFNAETESSQPKPAAPPHLELGGRNGPALLRVIEGEDAAQRVNLVRRVVIVHSRGRHAAQHAAWLEAHALEVLACVGVDSKVVRSRAVATRFELIRLATDTIPGQPSPKLLAAPPPNAAGQ